MDNRFKEIQNQLNTFCDKRDWGQFHSPKNLTMAMVGEAGELIEHFQWLTEEESYLKNNHTSSSVLV